MFTYRLQDSIHDFDSTTTGGTDVRRRVSRARLEAAWSPAPEWDIVLSGEIDNLREDGDLSLKERRSFDRPDVPDETIKTDESTRVSYDQSRVELDVGWDVSPTVRLRAGEEFYLEKLDVSGDTPRAEHFGGAGRGKL